MTDSVADPEKGLNGFRNAKVEGSIPFRSTIHLSIPLRRCPYAAGRSPKKQEKQTLSVSAGPSVRLSFHLQRSTCLGIFGVRSV